MPFIHAFPVRSSSVLLSATGPSFRFSKSRAALEKSLLDFLLGYDVFPFIIVVWSWLGSTQWAWLLMSDTPPPCREARQGYWSNYMSITLSPLARLAHLQQHWLKQLDTSSALTPLAGITSLLHFDLARELVEYGKPHAALINSFHRNVLNPSSTRA